MFCKNCGKEINEGAAFCGYCGTTQQDVQPKEAVTHATDVVTQPEYVHTSATEAVNSPNYTQPGDGMATSEMPDMLPKKNKKGLIIAIVAVVIVVAVVVGFFVYKAMADKDESDKFVGTWSVEMNAEDLFVFSGLITEEGIPEELKTTFDLVDKVRVMDMTFESDGDVKMSIDEDGLKEYLIAVLPAITEYSGKTQAEKLGISVDELLSRLGVESMDEAVERSMQNLDLMFAEGGQFYEINEEAKELDISYEAKGGILYLTTDGETSEIKYEIISDTKIVIKDLARDADPDVDSAAQANAFAMLRNMELTLIKK